MYFFPNFLIKHSSSEFNLKIEMVIINKFPVKNIQKFDDAIPIPFTMINILKYIGCLIYIKGPFFINKPSFKSITGLKEYPRVKCVHSNNKEPISYKNKPKHLNMKFNPISCC